MTKPCKVKVKLNLVVLYMTGKVKVKQCIRYVHSCLEAITLIPMNTYNPSWMPPVVHDPFVKPSSGCQFSSQGLLWQKIQEPLTQNNPH